MVGEVSGFCELELHVSRGRGPSKASDVVTWLVCPAKVGLCVRGRLPVPRPPRPSPPSLPPHSVTGSFQSPPGAWLQGRLALHCTKHSWGF